MEDQIMKTQIIAVFLTSLFIGGTSYAQSDLGALERLESRLSREAEAKRQQEAEAKAAQEKNRSVTTLVTTYKATIINDYLKQGHYIEWNDAVRARFPWNEEKTCHTSHIRMSYEDIAKAIFWDIMVPIVKGVASPKTKWESSSTASLLYYIGEVKKCGKPELMKDLDVAIRMAESLEPELRTAVEARAERVQRQKEAEEATQAAKQQRDGAAQAAHVAALRSGKTPIKNLADAVARYEAVRGELLIVGPPLKHDDKIYVWSGRVDKVRNDTEFFVRTTALGKTGFALVKLNSKSVITAEPRQGHELSFVGRFAGTVTIRTSTGRELIAPAFEILFMG